MVVHTSNPGIQEVEAGGSAAHGYPGLHKGFEASLGYLRLCLNCLDGSGRDNLREVIGLVLLSDWLSF